MAIKQISVYAENSKGALSKVTGVLADANVDLRSLCIADTDEYGIIRIVADDTKKAQEAVTAAGLTFNVREVVAVAIPDESGGLHRVLEILDRNEINLEYAYSLITAKVDSAYIVLRVDDNVKTERVLKENGIRVLGEGDI
ncbi:MAG: ACT domain-containing protein [Lachnospiraceae bacterium]|nr:ACT domain-containing protein [Lachnospiraceae bacterium]